MAGSLAPPVPRYGSRSLAELVPSLLSSLGLAGFTNALALEPAERVCLMLVDGLGWELLAASRSTAPFLNSIAHEPLTAGFPATTAASLSSLAGEVSQLYGLKSQPIIESATAIPPPQEHSGVETATPVAAMIEVRWYFWSQRFTRSALT